MLLPQRMGSSKDRRMRQGFIGDWRVWLSLAVALLVLNFALTFHNVWPTLWITTRGELSAELAALLLLIVLYSEIVRIPSKRGFTLLAVVVLLFSIGRYAEVTAPALYGRRVNLYWDAPHLLNVFSMLRSAATPLTIALASAGVIAILALAFIAIRWSLGRVRSALDFTLARWSLGALGAGLVALYLVGYTSAQSRALSWFSIPVTTTYWQQAQFSIAAFRQARNPDTTVCERTPRDYNVSAFEGADVLVVFMESYGALAYDRPEVAEVVAQSRAGLADALDATGRSVVSAFVASPTFGGASWLAHSSLLTGRAVRDNGTYNLLLTQSCDVLTQAFAQSGYRVVALMPGLKLDWPEGAFYGFDEIYGERALAYGGPEFGWWRIPDQYSLAKLDQLELSEASRAPVFLFFPTISSHMPFRPTPPYQTDWMRLLADTPFDAAEVAASLAVEPDWTNLAPDYAATISYAFDYVAGYLRERAERDLVLVLLGDHQPPASVAGEDARWDVPVHVIASRPERLERLLRAGFVTGLDPDPEPVAEMHELTSLLFGGAGAEP